MLIKEKCNLVQVLIDYSFGLLHSFQNNLEIELLDDYTRLVMVNGMLQRLQDLIHTENIFYSMIGDCIDAKNEKGKEITVSGGRIFQQNILIPLVEDLFDVSKTWKFDDYRAINFQSDLRDTMKLLMNHYKKK